MLSLSDGFNNEYHSFSTQQVAGSTKASSKIYLNSTVLGPRNFVGHEPSIAAATPSAAECIPFTPALMTLPRRLPNA